MKKIYFNIIFTLILVCSIFVGRNVSAYDFSNFDAYNDKLTYEMIEELTKRAYSEEIANSLLSNYYIHCFVQEHYNHIVGNVAIECKFIDTNGISVYLYQNSAGNYMNSSSYYGSRWTYLINRNAFSVIDSIGNKKANSSYFYNETPTDFWWINNGITSVITQTVASEDFYVVYNGEKKYFKKIGTSNPYNGMSYLDIPLSDMYNEEENNWIPYQKYFTSVNEDNSYNFYITYIDDSSSELPSLPLELFVTNDIFDIENHVNNIANSVHSSADGYGGGFSVGGGTFGGGGGGGRFTDEDSCLNTDNYTYYNNVLSSDKHYGFLSLTPNSCVDISSTIPSDYKTQYIRIYYDVSFYTSVDEVVDEYIENVNKDLGNYTESIKHFNNPIKEILIYISTFYNGLPLEFKYLIISLLIISIYLVIIRFIL